MSQPDAFRPTATGLLVPEELSRARRVWTREESRLVDRAFAFLRKERIQFALGCEICQGAEKPLQIVRGKGGERIARCGCTDRVLMRTGIK